MAIKLEDIPESSYRRLEVEWAVPGENGLYYVMGLYYMTPDSSKLLHQKQLLLYGGQENGKYVNPSIFDIERIVRIKQVVSEES
jgi:hypothetical protein